MTKPEKSLFKRALQMFGVFLILAITGVVLSYQLVSDAVLVGWIIDPLEDSQGIDISASGGISVSRGLIPELTATGLSIRDQAGLYVIEVDRFVLALRLTGLLEGKLELDRVSIGQLRVEILAVADKQAVGEPNQAAASGFAFPLTPFVHALKLGGVTFKGPSDEFALPTVKVVEYEVQAIGPMVSHGFVTEIAGTTIRTRLTFPRLRKMILEKRANFTLSMASGGTEIQAVGTVDFGADQIHIDADIHAQASTLSAIAEAAGIA